MYYCCCESPQRTFQVRNDGQPPLANDTPATVAIPAGTISAEGRQAIFAYLINRYRATSSAGYYHLAYGLDAAGDSWQTSQGNYTKRLSKLAYTDFKLTLPPDVLSEIGNIARDHCGGGEITVAMTRDLNKGPEDFYHEDSCWWDSYSYSRCTLKSNGGFGMRSFDNNWGEVSGRAWVIPLRDRGVRLVPTFDAMTPDAFVVFNGYGKLESYTAPRVLAQMAGWTYRRISLDAANMYINSCNYLVASEDTAHRFPVVRLSTERHSDLFAIEQAAQKEAEKKERLANVAS